MSDDSPTPPDPTPAAENPTAQPVHPNIAISGGTMHGPVIAANSGTVNVSYTSAISDPAELRRRWMTYLAQCYAASVPAVTPDGPARVNAEDAAFAAQLAAVAKEPLRTLRALEWHLMQGMINWPRDGQPDSAPPSYVDREIAAVRVALLLWPLLIAQPYDLTFEWARGFAVLASDELLALLTTLRREYWPKQTDTMQEVMWRQLLEAIGEAQYQAGVTALLGFLADPVRLARMEAHYAAMPPPRLLIPPPRAGLNSLQLLLATLSGSTIGGASTALLSDLVAHGEHSLLGQIWQRLATPAHAAERPVLSVSQDAQIPAVPDAVQIPGATRVPTISSTSGQLRMPTTIAQWRSELAQRDRHFGTHGLQEPTIPYWCYAPGGTYPIGGWNPEQAAARLAIKEFWIARVPVTVAQYRVFLEQGGYSTRRWWTSEGWKYGQEHNDTQPRRWNNARYTQSNQPVIGVTWYEAVAFCNWLSEQLGSQLPSGYIIRLPTEAEWEVAAAFDQQGQRRTYPWGNTPEPTSKYAIFKESFYLDAPASVGSCPAGAAASGALDMAGNVREWTSSASEAYPDQANVVKEDFTPNRSGVPLRGGANYIDSTYVRCGTRLDDFPLNLIIVGELFGFRIVVALQLAR